MTPYTRREQPKPLSAGEGLAPAPAAGYSLGRVLLPNWNLSS